MIFLVFFLFVCFIFIPLWNFFSNVGKFIYQEPLAHCLGFYLPCRCGFRQLLWLDQDELRSVDILCSDTHLTPSPLACHHRV